MKEEKWICRVLNNRAVLAILLFTLCAPYMLTRDIEGIKEIYMCLILVVSGAVILLYARYGAWNTSVKWLTVFILWSFLTTYFVSGELPSFLRVYFPIIALALLAELAVQYRVSALLDMVAVFRIYIYVNLILVFMYPTGCSGAFRWLLGYRNIQSWFLLPLATMLIIRALWKFGRIDWWTAIDLLVIAVTIKTIKSATSLVGAVVYGILLLVCFICYRMKKKLPVLCSLFSGLLLSAAFYAGIIVLKLQKIFEPLIVNVLKRDMSFTSRTTMWDMTREYLHSHWLAGGGYMTVSAFKKMFSKYSHPHNFILSVMMQGGIVLLLIVCIGFGIAAVRLYRNRQSVISSLFVSLLFSFLVMGFTEALSPYLCPLLYPMVVLAMHTQELDGLLNKETGSETGH